MSSPSHKECWARSSVFDGSWPACAPFQVFTCFANPELDCCSICVYLRRLSVSNACKHMTRRVVMPVARHRSSASLPRPCCSPSTYLPP